jgi:hypothetical protein
LEYLPIDALSLCQSASVVALHGKVDGLLDGQRPSSGWRIRSIHPCAFTDKFPIWDDRKLKTAEFELVYELPVHCPHMAINRRNSPNQFIAALLRKTDISDVTAKKVRSESVEVPTS